jgi:hypothetical protein
MKLKRKLLGNAALMVLVLLLSFMSGNTGAMYLTDGTKTTTTPGVYVNPQDGVCVVGLKFDGTLDVNPSIYNNRDCVVYTTPAIKALDKTACEGGAGNDGFRHSWSTSICVDGSNNPISRVNLDNTVAMCQAKGGTIRTTGQCVAYGWQYMNVKAAETIPYRSTINPVPAGYKGRTSADKLGFCYTPMRMTSAYGTATACPSIHNDNTAANPNLATEWPLGTDGVRYQTQLAYDAGLGWTFSNSQCVYAYGVKGYTNGTTTAANGATIAANTYVDLTGITTMGACLAAGYSWDNWLPYGDGSGTNGNASLQTVLTTPSPANNSTIVKLDAISPVANGGGKFYSNTGSICTKCHTDQSRSYMERITVGFVESDHKKSGDKAAWANVGSEWGLKGVQCEICHATAKPGQQDVGIVIYPNTTGPNAGLPRAATGHNNVEYGSHVNGICFYCHGTNTAAPAVIPVSGGDFALTSKNLAPIANEFLNSPHAKYSLAGTSRTVDIITKTNYSSTFASYLCRTGVTTVSGTWNSTTCPAAGHSWVQPAGATAAGCYYNATSCAAAPGSTWHTTFDTNMYPVNNGGVCSGIALGSIITTVYQNGAAGEIPQLDSFTNPFCTNYGSGNPSGASGYVVKEGEAASTINSVAVAATDQGNCMTCHNVHWGLADTNPEAEPIRRECTTCHMNPGTSATNAPQATSFNHPQGADTPLENINTEPFEACIICHMPLSSSTGSRMHLWRINTNSAYQTMGATQANTAPDGSYTNAAWVDISKSCGQCHQSGGVAYSFTKAQLAGAAKGMHSGGSASNSECLSCHSSGAGGAFVITPGTNHHDNTVSCTSCHVNGHNGPLPNKFINSFCLDCHEGDNHHAIPGITAKCVSCHTIPGVTVPPMTNITQITTGCLGCHNAPQGTKNAIVPSSTYGIDNHHLGSDTKHFVSTTNNYGCKGCHGGGKSTSAATGKSGTLFCNECHASDTVQTGAGKNHHSADNACLSCHMADGSFSGATGAGVASGQSPQCLYCHDNNSHANNVPGPGPINQGVNHHLGVCTSCHGANGGVAAATIDPNSLASVTNGCLVCHSSAVNKSGGGTLPKIVPEGSTDNHHKGKDSLTAGLVQGKGCLACHGMNGGLPTVKATGLSGNDLCNVCHGPGTEDNVIQSGTKKDHHAGTCTGCHAVDGSSTSGAPGAGVETGSGSITTCLTCHAADAPKALIQHPTKPTDPTCQNCHQAGGFVPTFASACNWCHGGSLGPTAAVKPAPYLTAAKLSTSATTMHKNVAPKASFTLIATDSAATAGIQVKVGAPVQVQDTSTDQNGNLATITVAWGDGKTSTIDPGATTPVHTYAKTGSITITLTAIDANGLKATATAKITVVK